jgi:ribonuclease-3 family protein
MELIDREKEEIDINLLSPLTWAYVGDAIYELFIRTHLVNNTKLKPHKLHIESIKYVKAKAQANILKELMDKLSEEEKEIVRRARNAENHHLPKNANPEDYMYSTAFEGLIGYLYLSKKDERLKEILDESLKIGKQQYSK